MNKSLRMMLAAIAVVAVGAIPLIAFAQDDEKLEGRGRVTRQSYYRVTTPATSSDDVYTIAPAGTPVITNRGPVTVSYTVTLSGAPAEFRLSGPDGIVSPGNVRFTPTGDSATFSATFVDPGEPRNACRNYQLRWRSPTGEAVTLHASTLVLTYRFENRGPDGTRFICL